MHAHGWKIRTCTGAGGAGVREGAVTDQEEGGGSRERGRPSSRSSPKGFKLDEAMSSLRITGSLGGDGSSWALGLERDGGTGAPMLDLAGSEHEHRPRQDSSRSPLPHDDAAGGEDDASVLDTLLQRNVSAFLCASISVSFLHSVSYVWSLMCGVHSVGCMICSSRSVFPM